MTYSDNVTLDIRDYGGSPSVDNTGPYNAMIADALSRGFKRVRFGGFGNAVWNFDSQPIDNPGIYVSGDGPSATVLTVNFNGDAFLFLGRASMGGGMENLSIVKGAGFSGGSAIKLIGVNGQSPDYSLFRYLDITESGGTWSFPFAIDGTARTNEPIGVRDVKVQDVDLFAGTSGSASLMQAIGLQMSNVSAYPAGGTSATFYIGSGSNTNTFIGMNVEGELNISHSQNIRYDGFINTLNTDSSGSHCRLTGLSGTGPIKSSNLINSLVDFN